MPTVDRFDGGVDVGADMQFERKWWRTERILWVLMTLFILGGLLGLFGRGPLSKARESLPGVPVSVEYERVLRFETPARINLFLTRDAVPMGAPLQVRVNQALLDTLQIQNTLPQPLRIESVDDGAVLTFAADPQNGWARVAFTQKSGKDWLLHGEIGLYGMSMLPMTQFVFP